MARRRSRTGIYLTRKGQPYKILPSGKARFISKREAGMSDLADPDLGDPGRRRKRVGNPPKSKYHHKTEMPGVPGHHILHEIGDGMGMMSLGEIGKLVRKAGQCVTVITSKGIKSICPARPK